MLLSIPAWGFRFARRPLFALGLALCLACGGSEAPPAPAPGPAAADAAGNTEPSATTRAANEAAARTLPSVSSDFEDAERGLIARDERVRIEAADGSLVWDLDAYAFLGEDAPPSVHPSLWRQARLNNLHGLYRVTEGVYQVRGYDLSNLTVVQGERGFIVIDPLTARETAAAAMALVRRELGDKPVTAVIYTHSHVDHFGGVVGALREAERAPGAVPILAPAGFMHEATSENVMAGVAMSRRAAFMYGRRLPRGERGHVDSGLGKSPAFGTVGVLPPTDEIARTGEERVLDGVRFVFQYAPESEAPAELTFYLPDRKAFCGAEVVSRNLHNVYTLRGAKVRDALRWSGYIDEALRLFGEAELMFNSHHWPTWGNAAVVENLKVQRDTYKFIHDQTLRLANGGATPREIAEQLELPPGLRGAFHNRDYYGTVRHNAKAVYQWYFGWFDANPAHLNPLPPAEAALRYVEAMGGAAEVQRKAQDAHDAGEYRWAATLLDHLVFADPGDDAARALLAASYDQLGYQAESGPWRDFYLTGAFELRHGGPEQPFSLGAAIDLLRHTPSERFLESLATRVDPAAAADETRTVNFVFTDTGESFVLQLENAVLHHRAASPDPAAEATLRITKALFLDLATGRAGLREVLFSDDVAIEGSRLGLLGFFSLFDQPDTRFAIVTP